MLTFGKRVESVGRTTLSSGTMYSSFLISRTPSSQITGITFGLADKDEKLNMLVSFQAREWKLE